MPSEKAMLIPAPMAVAKPTRKAVWLSRVAKAAANRGASDEMDPSIKPAKPGWTTLRTNARCSSGVEIPTELVITSCSIILFSLLCKQTTLNKNPKVVRIKAVKETQLVTFGYTIK
jgi:hypothetical protein